MNRDTDALLEGTRKAILRSNELIAQTKALLEQSAQLIQQSTRSRNDEQESGESTAPPSTL